MSDNIYTQSDNPAPTLTVGDLVDRLKKLDPSLPVIFKTPASGAFGPLTDFTIESAEVVSLKRKYTYYPASTGEDEETGEPYAVEAWTHVDNAWKGVVLK